MSESDEDVTVDAGGVSVRKSLNDHQFETLAVVFDVRSERENAAGITLVDAVPDDVPVDDIGFHPEYGGEHWQAGEGQVVFGRTFEPGEQYTTVYGIRDFDGDRAALLSEPDVEIGALEVEEAGGLDAVGGEAGPVAGVDDLVSEEDSQIVREVISGERDTLPGLEDEGAASAGASADGEAPGAGGAPEPADEPVGSEAAAGEDDGRLADVDLPEPGETSPDAETDEESLDEEIASLGAGETTEDVADAETGDLEADEVEAETVDEAEADAADHLGTDGEIANIGGGDPAEDEATPDDLDMDEEPPEPGGETADATEPTADDAEPEEVADEPDADEAEAGVGAVVTDVGEATSGEDEDAAAEADGEEADAARADDEITVPVTGGIARVLAKELRAGNVSYEDRRLLREELLPDDGSTDARIQHLQNKVADLEAYTDALEQFLDEEGGAQAALERIEERVDSLAADVEAVEETVGGIDDDVGSLRDDVADVEEEVDDVAEGVDEVDEEVEAVAGDVERVSDDVGRLEGDVDSVRDDVRRIDQVDRRLGGVEDDVSAIHDELADLATFRDRLSSVFGPGGGPGAEGEGDEEGSG